MLSSPFSLMFENPSHFRIQSILTFFWSTIATTLTVTIGLYAGTQLSGYHPRSLQFPVQRSNCTCDCWDGYFRGVHSRGGYKTFYINYEQQTIILVGIFLFYTEMLRNFLIKLITHRQLTLVLLVPAIYSNFYGIWNIINYLNDHDYNRMLPSQLYFCVTELVANYIFYQCLLMNATNTPIPPWCAYLVTTFCSVHILLAAKELNIELMRRNTLLLVPDVISLVWVAVLLKNDPELRPNKLDACIWLVVGVLTVLFYYTVCPFRE